MSRVVLAVTRRALAVSAALAVVAAQSTPLPPACVLGGSSDEAAQSCSEAAAACAPLLTDATFTAWVRPNPSAPAYVAVCAPDGATLAARINGAASTFAHGSSLWTSATLLAADAVALTATTEAKLRPWLDTAGSGLRIAFTAPNGGVGATTVCLASSFASLTSLFASAAPPAVVSPVSNWIGFVPGGATYETGWSTQGVNIDVASSALTYRLGAVFNNEADAGSPDTAIGLGGRVVAYYGTTGDYSASNWVNPAMVSYCSYRPAPADCAWFAPGAAYTTTVVGWADVFIVGACTPAPTPPGTPLPSASPLSTVSRSPSLTGTATPSLTPPPTGSPSSTLSTGASPSHTVTRTRAPPWPVAPLVVDGLAASGSVVAGQVLYFAYATPLPYGVVLSLTSVTGDADLFVGRTPPDPVTGVFNFTASSTAGDGVVDAISCWSRAPAASASGGTGAWDGSAASSCWGPSAGSTWYVQVSGWSAATFTLAVASNLGDPLGVGSPVPSPFAGAAPLALGVAAAGTLAAADEAIYWSLSQPPAAGGATIAVTLHIVSAAGDADLLVGVSPPFGARNALFNSVWASTNAGDDAVVLPLGGGVRTFYVCVKAFAAPVSFTQTATSPLQPAIATTGGAPAASDDGSRGRVVAIAVPTVVVGCAAIAACAAAAVIASRRRAHHRSGGGAAAAAVAAGAAAGRPRRVQGPRAEACEAPTTFVNAGFQPRGGPRVPGVWGPDHDVATPRPAGLGVLPVPPTRRGPAGPARVSSPPARQASRRSGVGTVPPGGDDPKQLA